MPPGLAPAVQYKMASNSCGAVFKAHSSAHHSYTSPQGSSYAYSHLPSSQKRYTAPVGGTNYPPPMLRRSRSENYDPPMLRRSRSDLLSNSVVLEGRELRGVVSFHGDTSRSFESCQPRSFPQPSPSQSSPSQPFHSLGSHGNESTRMPPLRANPEPQSAAAVPDHHRQNHPNTGSAAHSTSHRPSNRCFSQATLENEHYSLDGLCTPDHANEDRYFSLENSDYRVFAVFDGHDGGRAAGFASSYMHQLFATPSWNHIVAQAKPAIIHEALNEFFKVTEQDFFKSIQRFIAETEYLQSIIPQVCEREGEKGGD